MQRDEPTDFGVKFPPLFYSVQLYPWIQGLDALLYHGKVQGVGVHSTSRLYYIALSELYTQGVHLNEAKPSGLNAPLLMYNSNYIHASMHAGIN